VDTFGAQPWYRKAVLILLLPFVLPTIPLVLVVLACFGLYAVAGNYLMELQIRRRMRRSGRYLNSSDVRQLITKHGGTLIIENPSLGWNFRHAWWTPDNVESASPFGAPTDEDYKDAAAQMKCLDWDRWCWDNYTSLDSGRAFLLRVWNGAWVERKLKKMFPNLNVVRTWTALVHFPIPPESPNASAT
jgi:hypothetical protein